MASVVQVFDRFGTKLGEFYQDVTREWLLNEPGDAEFSLSVAAETQRLSGAGEDLRRLVEFGNLVHVTHAKLGNWTGVIVQRRWRKGTVVVRAAGAEQVLAFATVREPGKARGTAGAIYTRLLSVANDGLDTKILPGAIWGGGVQREETLEGMDLLSETQRVAERAGNDFDVVGDVGRSLVLSGNWYEAKGIETAVELCEGYNLATPGGDLLVEDGWGIANRVIGWPDSAAKNARGVMVMDEASAAVYGPRWSGEVFTNVTGEDTLLKHCEEELRRRARPVRLIGCAALDVGDTFDGLRVGNRVGVQLLTAGFLDNGRLGTKMRGRVLGMRFSDADQRLELAIEEAV